MYVGVPPKKSIKFSFFLPSVSDSEVNKLLASQQGEAEPGAMWLLIDSLGATVLLNPREEKTRHKKNKHCLRDSAADPFQFPVTKPTNRKAIANLNPPHPVWVFFLCVCSSTDS